MLPNKNRIRFSKLFIAALLLMNSLINPAPAADKKETLHASSNDQPIKIGFLVPLTGPAAAGGHDMVNGISLYLEQNHYQIAGHKVQLVVEDDEGHPTLAAVKVSEKLVAADHVQIIDGVFAFQPRVCGGTWLADELKTPLIIAIAFADDLTMRKHSPWVIRLSRSPAKLNIRSESGYTKLGYKRVAIFGLDFAMGWETAGGFQENSSSRRVDKWCREYGRLTLPKTFYSVSPAASQRCRRSLFCHRNPCAKHS